MRRPIIHGTVVAVGVLLAGPGRRAQAVDVATGDGIVVVDMTAEESKMVLGAVDSAAAFAALVSPFLPAEYQVAVKLAAGGWKALRPVIPRQIALRAVVTTIPPTILLLPQAGVTSAEVIRTYSRLRERSLRYVKTAYQETAGVAVDRFDASRRELAGYLSNTMLAAAVRERVAADHMHRWIDRLPAIWSSKHPDPRAGRLVANRDEGGESERFTVQAHPDGTVSLRAHTGYLSAEAGGGGCAACNRRMAKEWERWTVVQNEDGTVGLKSSGGCFLHVDAGDQAAATADRVKCDGKGTKFVLEFADGAAYLKTPGGKYLSVQP